MMSSLARVSAGSIFFEIEVDGKITTGIEGLRKIGNMRANQRRPRRVDETASTVHGCNEGAGIITSPTKMPLDASQQLILTSRGLFDVSNEAPDIHVQSS